MQPSLGELFGRAVSLHQAGQLPQAEALYRQILAAVPDHPDGLHLLGLLAHQAGQPAAGLPLVDRAVQLQPEAGAYHDTRGQVLKALGRVPEAIEAHRIAARLQPQSFGPLYNLGNVLQADRQFEAAAETYRLAAAQAPGFVGVHNNLGNVWRLLDRLDEAAAAFRTALSLQPGAPELMFNLASVLADRDETRDEAHAMLDQLIRGLGEAIRQQPGDERAHELLGTAWIRRGDWGEAASVFQHAVLALPNSVLLWNRLAEALIELNRYAEAEAALRGALRRLPEAAPLWDGLAQVLNDGGRPDEAASCAATALRLDPAFGLARCSLAVIALGAGRYTEGWAQYEARWSALNRQLPFDGPVWDGTPAPGRMLTVYEEQGAGDFIQLCRLVPHLAERMPVQLRVPPGLRRLIGTLAGRQALIDADAPRNAAPGLHCPMMSLPHAIGLTLETLPGAPYLHADPALVAAWRKRLAALPGLRVGLAWAGNPTLVRDRHRSIPADALGALAGTAGVSFVSLQKGGAPWTVLSPGQRAALGLVDWTESLDDFADTAALAAALDLVVCVDTAVAHVAGAIGQRVWLLNRFDTDWRWMRDRADSPWYPTMRIIRQATPGDWAGVLAETRTALEAESAGS